MNLQERKNALIHWLTEVEDEALLEQVESLQQNSLSLPSKIEQLLEMSAKTPAADCIAHTSIKDLLRKA